jgi:hypothetical protein
MSKHEEVATIGMWERIKTWLGLQDSNLRESLEDVLDEESHADSSLRNEELHMMRNLLGLTM